MADDLGGDTRDLLALGQPHPAEQGLTPDQREAAALRHGRRCRWTGVTILALLYIICLSFAVISDNGMAVSSNSELFYVLAMMAATVTGGLFLGAGLAERREQPIRAMLRQNRTDLVENGRRLDTVMGLVAAVPGRLDAMQRELNDLEAAIAAAPNYGRGVIDGMQLRADALGPESE